GHRGATGMVGTEDLPQEDPQRDERRIDALHPEATDRGQGALDEILGEHVGERQIPFLQELPAQETGLLPKPPVVTLAHAWGLLATDGLLPKPSSQARPISPMSLRQKGLLGIYVPFVGRTEARIIPRPRVVTVLACEDLQSRYVNAILIKELIEVLVERRA